MMMMMTDMVMVMVMVIITMGVLTGGPVGGDPEVGHGAGPRAGAGDRAAAAAHAAEGLARRQGSPTGMPCDHYDLISAILIHTCKVWPYPPPISRLRGGHRV
jgi:hypothetical protein